MNHLEYNQFLADNAGSPESIFQDLETTNALHIKAEKIFGICFELEDGEFNDEIYLKVGKVINDFNIQVSQLESEISVDGLKSIRALIGLSKYFLEIFKIPEDLEELRGASEKQVRSYVSSFLSLYDFLNGINESDFRDLKYQFIYDYETDRYWQMAKDLISETKGYLDNYDAVDHPLYMFDCNRKEIKSILIKQLLAYANDTSEKEDYVSMKKVPLGLGISALIEEPEE